MEDLLDNPFHDEIKHLNDNEVAKLESLIFPDKSKRGGPSISKVSSQQNTTYRLKDYDMDAVNHSIIMPTEIYHPHKGKFKKTTTSKTESIINEKINETQINLILSVLSVTLEIYNFNKSINAENVYSFLNA